MTESTPTVVPHPHEREQIVEFIKRKLVGMRAVVAAPNTGRGADRSVVLIQGVNGAWVQAVKCWHGDHRARATALVQQYNGKQVSST